MTADEKPPAATAETPTAEVPDDSEAASLAAEARRRQGSPEEDREELSRSTGGRPNGTARERAAYSAASRRVSLRPSTVIPDSSRASISAAP